MVSSRLVYVAGFIAAAAITAVATWFIVTSPGGIDDVPRYVVPSGAPGEPVTVSVAAGEGARQIGQELEAKGVIASARQFEVLVGLMGYNAALQAGDYEFARGTPVLQVVQRMRRGVLASRSLTVVEGWRLEEAADAAAQLGIDRDDFLAAARSNDYDFDFVRALEPDQDLEGFLYPATYPVLAGDAGRTMVEKMLRAFRDNVPQGIVDSAAASGMDLPQVLTLASIIEREARVADERPVMAQVFRRRLAEGIPLQADPTVQYAIATPESAARYGWWKRDLTLADLAFDSPYNTYVYQGLPPGPICNPSLDSIIAVVQPADTDYLYFVAKPDGSHAFAETLAEHEANVRRYRGE